MRALVERIKQIAAADGIIMSDMQVLSLALWHTALASDGQADALYQAVSVARADPATADEWALSTLDNYPAWYGDQADDAGD